MYKKLQAQSEEEASHRTHILDLFLCYVCGDGASDFFSTERRIEKYIEPADSFALEIKTENHRHIVYPYDSKRIHTIICIEYTIERDAIVIDDDMDKGVSIDIVEDIDACENHEYDTEEIFSHQKAHHRPCDNHCSRDSIPPFASFESARKCPRKRSHKFRYYQARNSPLSMLTMRQQHQKVPF